ncbi:isochorismatase family protein [Pusillimonas sp. ANT_WB101]|uniref:isochorismatase family protein n=1 Tax=Pusillimonas sp. ANT_WB101 TaxID=2597356 RepID=UPI0011EE5813|nr:isochorismatase family protein [Pusillimonas sp. ANT_WB101]KAA0890018.1 isochorismatase family protein [Pusillimonas sp. ANT_WB101]
MSIPAIAAYSMPQVAFENRADWTAEPNRAVLLIHDMQYYFLKKYDMQAEPVPTLIRHIQQLRKLCHAQGIPVIYTAQPTTQPPQDRALLTDFWGPGLSDPRNAGQEKIIAELAPAAHDAVQTKWRYSAFFRSDLKQLMQEQGRDQLLITGIYAHIGCLTTALDAFMNDIQPFFVTDATADFSAEEHAMGIKYVSQRCGVCVTTDSLQGQLSGLPVSPHQEHA